MPVQVVSSLPSQLAHGFDVDDEDGRSMMMLLLGDVPFHGSENVVSLSETRYPYTNIVFVYENKLAIY